jgi:hypothetical protein
MTGCHRWLVIIWAISIGLAVICALALGTQVAAAKECHRETPLPADVQLIAPGPEVPEAVARFAGAWSGAWLDQGSSELECHTLAVEEVLVNGYARVIVSSGTYVDRNIPLPEFFNIRLPAFVRVTGRIVDGELRVQLPLPPRPKHAYRLAGDTPQATREGPVGTDHVRLTRVADLSQLGCGQLASGLPPAPPTTGPRDRLTATALLAPANAASGLVHNDYFMPVGQATPALHPFQGTVTVQATSMSRARYGCPILPETFPGFTVAFFTQAEHLVPVVRDVLQPPGTVILSPGRVWSEPGDGGMSRASFPFVLTSQHSNRTHNGLATFLYDETRVSALQFQLVQETAAWAKYDGWGQAPMTYSPGSIPNDEVVRAQFAAELRQQTPIRPWSALQSPSGAQWLERFDGDAAPEDISANGLIVDGVIYLRGCQTRAGPYPYCQHMRHGVFSMTKSLGAAMAMLRLAQRYGEQVFDLKIKDYLTVTATHDGWERVTFGDAINMATGIGDNSPRRTPNDFFADENKPKMFKWGVARTAKAKLDVSFAYGKYPWGPGEVLRYNSTQTFVLGAAMDSFLKRQAGPGAHLWDMVAGEVFQPLGIFHAPMMHTLEADGGRGLPILAVGLYPTIDDLAKLTTLLQNGGQHQGQQILHAAKLAEALYKTATMGLPTGVKNRYGEARYHQSFWSVPYRTAHGCFFQIPTMGGFGGNLVVLLPNGISAFRIADGNNQDVEAMVLAGEAIRPFPCPAGAGEEPRPRQRQPLSASELSAALPGNTFYSDLITMFPVIYGHGNIFLSLDGVLYGTFTSNLAGGTWQDIGRWHITPEGQLCSRWHALDNRWERCVAVYREGETFELYRQDDWMQAVYRRAPGNPEGY